MKVKLLAISLVVMALSGCIGLNPGHSKEAPITPRLTRIVLAMGYIPNVQFAPFYVAMEKGYFTQEGIAVEFDYGWETDLLKLVGTGELQFAVASGDQVILARSQGLPVVYIFNWYRRFPVCIVSMAETGIKGPEDLIGKVVGTPAMYGASYIGWRAMLDAVIIDEKAVNLQAIGYTQVASLTEGRVDAAICYAMNEPVQLREQGYRIDVIYVADYMNLVSNGLITNEQTIIEQPDLVAGLVCAFQRGLRYTIEHPDEAFEICLKYVPEIGEENKPLQRAVLAESIEFWRSEALGHSSRSAWEASQSLIRQIGLIEAEVDVDRLFTNRFVGP